MKKAFLLLSIATTLSSCSSGPESATRNFTENAYKGKVTEAKRYATEPSGQILDLASSLGGMSVQPDFAFRMLKDSVVGNRAWVTFDHGNGKQETLKLAKIDGDWLVDLAQK